MKAEIAQNGEKRKCMAVCRGCGRTIQDQYILRVAPDMEWHAECLKCAGCGVNLDENFTCFVRNEKTYCKDDYVKLFGAKCSSCSHGFKAEDLVMRARSNIYHMECFRCVSCSRPLNPGDEFALRGDGLFCKADHETVEQLTCRSNSSPESNNNNVNAPNNNSGDSSPLGEKSSEYEIEDTVVEAESRRRSRDGAPGRGRGHGRKSDHKPTRVRTVLNEKQLHTLRTCYSANPRPDALMKEQLTEMTGLSQRVIRVWFQNKRCKDKKRSIAIKNIQQQAEKSHLHGVPMVASSPVRHESMANPIDVQQYPAPWKALTDFAMQSELEQPPFQQLVNSFDHPDSLYTMTSHPDDLHPPNSVSSDIIPGTPSELSSPMSQ